MKFMLIILMLASSPLVAQNYYVSFIKGKVSYNGKPVKLRSKITRKGELRFGTMDDYLKVSGPGGIYTLRPEKPAAGGTEFFTALRDELFPTFRMRTTVSGGMVFDATDPFWFDGGDGGIRWEGEGQNLTGELAEKAGQLFFLLKLSDSTLVSLPATIKKDKLVFRAETFQDYKIYRAGIVFVNDPAEWATKVATAKSFDEVGMISHTELIPPGTVIDEGMIEPPFNLVDYENFLLGNYQQKSANILLGDLYPYLIINRKALYKDLRRQIKWIKPDSTKELVDNNAFEDYIQQKYNLNDLPYSAYQYLRKRLNEPEE